MAETYTSRTLRELARIVASRFLGILLIVVFVVGAVAAATYVAPRWYRSEVQIMASPTRMKDPLEEVSPSLREQVSLFVTTQREIIRSDYVLAAALMMLDDPGKRPGGTTREGNGIGVELAFSDAEINDFIRKNTKRLRKFKEHVEVVTPGGPDASFTQTFRIIVDWPEDPESGTPRGKTQEQAAEHCFAVTDSLVRAYKARYQQIEEQRTKKASEFLQNKAVAAARQNLDAAVDALAAEAEKLGPDLMTASAIVGLQGIDSGKASQITQLEGQISTALARLAELQALEAALAKELAKPAAKLAVPDEVARNNNAIMLLQERVAMLKLDLNRLAPKFTDEYEEVRTMKDQLAEAQADLREEMSKQLERTRTSVAIQTAQRDELANRLAHFNKDMTGLGAQVIRYERLLNQAQSAERIYNQEEEKYLESLRAEKLAKETILLTVLDDPTRPDPADPRRPVAWLNYLIAAVGGVVLALVYAFLADHFDHTIKSVDDAERYLGAPVLSSVPKLGRRIVRAQ
jgi:uncharacterized protein involved in exopolysaccharide biosynthesis